MSLQLGGVAEEIRFRVEPREVVVVAVAVERVVVELALDVEELAVDAAFRAFWSSRADAFMAASIVGRLSLMYASTPRSIAQRKKLSFPTVV